MNFLMIYYENGNKNTDKNILIKKYTQHLVFIFVRYIFYRILIINALEIAQIPVKLVKYRKYLPKSCLFIKFGRKLGRFAPKLSLRDMRGASPPGSPHLRFAQGH